MRSESFNRGIQLSGPSGGGLALAARAMGWLDGWRGGKIERWARVGRWDPLLRAFESGQARGASAEEIEGCVWRACEAGEALAARAAARAALSRSPLGGASLMERLILARRWEAAAGLSELCADEPAFRARFLGGLWPPRESLIILATREASRLSRCESARALPAARRLLSGLARCEEALDELDERGGAALHLAAGELDPAGLFGYGSAAAPLCSALIGLGADVEARAGADGRTPLMSAARGLSVPALRALLAAGASASAVDAAGNSAAHSLCAAARWLPEGSSAWEEGMRALMEAGAEARAPNAAGQRPRDLLTRGVCEPQALERMARLSEGFDQLEASSSARRIERAMAPMTGPRAPRRAWL